MRGKRKPKIMLLMTSVAFFVLALTGTVGAMSFDLGNETKLDCDVSLTYAAGWRVKDREMNSIAMKNVNYDDGGWNFDQWDMINNKGTIVADIDISHNNFGFFVRPKAFYDFVYMNDNENPNSPKQLINNAKLVGLDYDEWDDEVEDINGADVEILDIFAYSSFDIGSRMLEVRVGRQVINWGESLYLSGGISTAQTYLDLNASTSPGVELKEVYLPAGAVSAQINILENLALSSYYQWEWQKNRFYEAGTFFSTRDTLVDTEFPLYLGYPAPFTTANAGDANEPSDTGEYGIALHTMVEALNNTEFGLYFSNYHDKWPVHVQSNLDPRNGVPCMLLTGNPAHPLPYYWLDYAEDIKMYGASFSTEKWDANIAGEVSYHQDVFIRKGSTYWDKGNYIQAQVSTIYGFSAPRYCDSSTLAAEVGINKVQGSENYELFYDKQAWGYRFTYTSSWLQVLQDLDLKIPISFSCSPNGDSSVVGSFTEGADTFGTGLEFTYKNLYLLNIRYTDYLNLARNERVDRDYVSLDLKYTF